MSTTRPRDLLPARIETERLLLRQPIRGDINALVRLADNRKIADMLHALPHPYTRADGIGFVEIIALHADERPYAITLKSDGAFIGVVGLSFADAQPPEIGYWLGEPYWGRGLATEAARGLLAAADATGAFPTVAAWAKAHNAASINVLTKLGLRIASHGSRKDRLGVEQPSVWLTREVRV